MNDRILSGRCSGRRWLLALEGALVLAGACTAPLYPGPRRPRREVATLDAAETEIDRVDGKMAPVEAETLEVLPGVHSVTVGARSYRRFIIHGQLVNALQAQTVCFRAAAGGAYWTAPVINEKERRWYPVVIDSKTRISVTVPCPGGNER